MQISSTSHIPLSGVLTLRVSHLDCDAMHVVAFALTLASSGQRSFITLVKKGYPKNPDRASLSPGLKVMKIERNVVVSCQLPWNRMEQIYQGRRWSESVYCTHCLHHHSSHIRTGYKNCWPGNWRDSCDRWSIWGPPGQTYSIEGTPYRSMAISVKDRPTFQSFLPHTSCSHSKYVQIHDAQTKWLLESTVTLQDSSRPARQSKQPLQLIHSQSFCRFVLRPRMFLC